MNKDIVSKSFYLTSLFSDVSTSGYTSNEIKLLMLLFNELSHYKIYIPDFYEIDSLNKSKLIQEISKVPLEYTISKKTFQEATNTPYKNLSREINKARIKLTTKTFNTPHPFEDDVESGESITWFSKITYSNKKNEIIIKINNDAVDRLVAFVKYTKLSFEYLSKLNSGYSVFTYIFIKIMKDTSIKSTLKKIKLDVNDFKSKLGLANKYKLISTFKQKVLDVVKKEINEYTDLNISYELIKEGRSFTKIEFTFDYNPESTVQKNKSTVEKTNIPKIIKMNNIDDYDSPFEQILISWNIRARKVVELEESYSLDVIQSAIDKTLEKEKTGEIKTTKAAIFLGILENKQLASDEQFERSKIELKQQQDKQLREQVSAEYEKHSAFILSNQDIIQSALTANTKHLPITDKDAISIFKKLKSIDADKFRAYTVPILSFYHFESNSNVSSILSDIVDRSHYIEIEEYKDDMAIVQAYKKALDRIKKDEYLSDEQKERLIKEVHEIINILLGL
jgi:plasmid replication initiation protein